MVFYSNFQLVSLFTWLLIVSGFVQFILNKKTWKLSYTCKSQGGLAHNIRLEQETWASNPPSKWYAWRD